MVSKALKSWICMILSVLLIVLNVSAVSEDVSDDQSEVQHWVELSEEAYWKQDYETAFHYSELAAKAGNELSQYMAAGYCYYGLGTEQSFEKAAEYFQMAADQGNLEAQAWLGSIHYYGLGFDQDYEKAASLRDFDVTQIGHVAVLLVLFLLGILSLPRNPLSPFFYLLSLCFFFLYLFCSVAFLLPFSFFVHYAGYYPVYTSLSTADLRPTRQRDHHATTLGRPRPHAGTTSDVDHFVAGRISHLPSVSGFCCAVAFVVGGVGERLRADSLRVLPDGA